MINVSAGDFDVLHAEDVLLHSDDYEAALSLEDSICKKVKDLMLMQGIPMTEDAVEIDYGNAIKVYNDCNIFSADQNDEKTIMRIAADGNYAWEVPVLSNGVRFRMVLSKGLPLSEEAKKALSEEEQRQVVENEGKLKLSAAGIIDDDTRYLYEWIPDTDYSGYNDPSVRLFGSQPGFADPVAVVFDKDSAVGCFSVGYETDYIFEEKTESFEKVAEWVKSIKPSDSDEFSGGSGVLYTTADVSSEENMAETPEKNSIEHLPLIITFTVVFLCILAFIGVKMKLFTR